MNSQELLFSLLAFTVSAFLLFLAHYIVGFIVTQLRRAVLDKLRDEYPDDRGEIPTDPNKGNVSTLTNWLGFTERTIAAALIIALPKQVPVFIGGWVALKFAANWKRKSTDHPKEWKNVQVARYSLIAMIGSAVSFTIAIATGLLLRCVLDWLD